MKNIGVRVLLPLMGGLILFGAGFATGGAYAARRASYAGSAASLVWLTGVDQALQSNDVAEARAVTAHAVDAHVAVLRQLDAAASSAILYVLPWSTDFDRSLSRHCLFSTREHFAAHPEEPLWPQTRAYLNKYTDP